MAMRSFQVHPDLAALRRRFSKKEYGRCLELVATGKTDNQAFAQMLVEGNYATQENVGEILAQIGEVSPAAQ